MIMSVDDIITKIPNQYRKAKESGDLYFFPSTVVRHREPDTDIEVSSHLGTVRYDILSKNLLCSFK